MNVLSNLTMEGSSLIIDSLDSFPSEPYVGQLILTDGIVYMYSQLSGVLSWYPLTNQKNYEVHVQGLASVSWTITHNIGTSDFIFFVYDENNKLIQATYNYIDDNSFTLDFTAAKKGKVVIFYAIDGNLSSTANSKGSISTVSSLPTPQVENYNDIVFVVGDKAYICTANTATPTSDDDVFWVEV
jgi:hypothetical protein